MNKLTVFYDHACGLCRSCRRWLDRQPTYFEVEFVAYDSLKARSICPEIAQLEPEREILALADNGDLYRGAAAWVMCLYATRTQRALSFRLSKPYLMPIAKKACALLSQNRLRISRLLGLRSDRDLSAAIATVDPSPCEEGGCDVR